MKKYILYLSFGLAAINFSCKKALQERVYSILTPETFYSTKTDANAALNAVFAMLKHQNYYQRTVYMVGDLSGDIIRPSNSNNARVQLYQCTYTATNGEIANWWLRGYSMIQRANDVITYVPGISSTELPTIEKNNIVGNAAFLRGLGYFNLVKSFGDVPLVLDVKNGDLFPTRAPAADVYAQVIADLENAEANCYNLNEIPAEEIGRVSKQAAQALLARVYLQKASTAFGSVTDNQKAVEYCNKVIAYSNSNPSVLTLSNNYESIFNADTKNGKECILSVQFSEAYGDIQANITKQMFTPPDLGGFGSLIGLSDFYNSYTATDTMRRRVNIGFFFNSINYISKYYDAGVPAGAFGRNNFIVLRYADVLLMQSEALNNISTGDASKFTGINLVRQRAMPGTAPLNFSNTATSADFINAIANERKWEFSVEGHRRWDLIRLKKLKEVKTAQGFAFEDFKLLFPLPQIDLDVNKNLVQNPGY
jgi:starch-binding outer membrane protein, SusD/RagB family